MWPGRGLGKVHGTQSSVVENGCTLTKITCLLPFDVTYRRLEFELDFVSKRSFTNIIFILV